MAESSQNGAARFRTMTERGQVQVAHPEGDLWCVSGRIPFDDDDSVSIIQARDSAEAETRFKEDLLAHNETTEAEMETESEPAVYINVVFRFACAEIRGSAARPSVKTTNTGG